MAGLLVFLVVVGVVAVYGVTIYNGLVTLRENVKKAFANIDVLLRQRHDEIPKLVETCKQYMGYEQETLEKVIAARSQVSQAREKGDMGSLGAAEGLLRSGLGQLFALVENYPDLKANENFQHLQHRISGLENAIADRREFYNEYVTLNNVGIEEFPDIIFARFFNFDPFDLLEFDSTERADVDIGALMRS